MCILRVVAIVEIEHFFACIAATIFQGTTVFPVLSMFDLLVNFFDCLLRVFSFLGVVVDDILNDASDYVV